MNCFPDQHSLAPCKKNKKVEHIFSANKGKLGKPVTKPTT